MLIFYIANYFRFPSNMAAKFGAKNRFPQFCAFYQFYCGNRWAALFWAQKYNFFVCTMIFKVAVRSKVKTVKSESRNILNDFDIDSYRFWVAESDYYLNFALQLILTSQWRHNHVSLFLWLNWLCCHAGSWGHTFVLASCSVRRHRAD